MNGDLLMNYFGARRMNVVDVLEILKKLCRVRQAPMMRSGFTMYVVD